MEALPEAMRVERGRWEFLEYAGTKPTARFQHAATVAGAKMYVIGGSFRGRFMNDTHELDLTTATWRRLKTKPGTSALPACAGHRAVTCRGVVFVVGGRFKGPETSAMSVYRMETKDDGLDEVEWVKIETGGDEAPCARRGASVTMVGEHKCIVFGGEDDERRFLNDAWILDMTSFVWRAVKAPGGHPPESRAEHTATMWGQDTLLVFGGTGQIDEMFFITLCARLSATQMDRGEPSRRGARRASRGARGCLDQRRPVLGPRRRRQQRARALRVFDFRLGGDGMGRSERCVTRTADRGRRHDVVRAEHARWVWRTPSSPSAGTTERAKTRRKSCACRKISPSTKPWRAMKTALHR